MDKLNKELHNFTKNRINRLENKLLDTTDENFLLNHKILRRGIPSIISEIKIYAETICDDENIRSKIIDNAVLFLSNYNFSVSDDI